MLSQSRRTLLMLDLKKLLLKGAYQAGLNLWALLKADLLLLIRFRKITAAIA